MPKKDKGVGDVIGETIFKAVKPIYKEGERMRRGARQSRRSYYVPEPKWSQKRVVFAVMPQAIRNAGSSPSVRDLYYAVRPLAYAHPEWPMGEVLNHNYFANTLSVQYERERGRISGLWRDPRGHFHEAHPRYALPLRDPHGRLVEDNHARVTVPLGTKEVDSYEFPPYLFDKILYVEKEGEWSKLLAARLPERYDMAIASAKGYSTTAVRDLFRVAERGKNYQLFIFHDADIDGYNIVRTLRAATWRMPHHSVELVDIGLTVEDALEMGLESEPFSREKDMSRALRRQLTDLEIEYFEERQERFELNAILPVERRIEYIERKLEERGVRNKLIPPDEALKDLALGICRDKHAAWVDEALREVLGLDAIKEALTDAFIRKIRLEDARSYIEKAFEEDRALSWRDALKDKLDTIHEDHAEDLKDALQQRITEKVKGGG
jgi:hypothetical protein